MAIAFDATASSFLTGNPTGTSLTYNHTCTGSNLILLVSVHVYNAVDIVSGVTYNSVAMTRLTQQIFSSDSNQRLYLYYLIAPATGTNQIAVTLSAGSLFTIMYSMSDSYTGVSQTGYPDATNSNTASGAGDIVGTVTTIANNAWTVMLSGSDDDNSNTAGSGTTIRVSSTGTNAARDTFADSNGPKTPAGSISLTVTPSAGTGGTAYIIASMAPAGGGAVVSHNFPLLGVGT